MEKGWLEPGTQRYLVWKMEGRKAITKLLTITFVYQYLCYLFYATHLSNISTDTFPESTLYISHRLSILAFTRF